MRRLPLLLCLLLCFCSCLPALASDLAPIVAQDAAVLPGDPAWPLARRDAGPLRFAIGLDPTAQPPDELARDATGQALVRAGSFRIDFDLAKTAEDCACVGTGVRVSHYRSRGIEFAVRASRPLAAVIFITTSSPDARNARDRFFGIFDVGTHWKVLRLPFRHFAADPAWPTEAHAAGFAAGDKVLRPDSVEALSIGVDARRTQPGQGALWVGGVRFFR